MKTLLWPGFIALGAAFLCGSCALDAGDPVAAAKTPPGKADLPNEGLEERAHDGFSNRAIAQFFQRKGFALRVDEAAIAAAWPLPGKTALLNRFGTPLFWTNKPYFHSALDVVRADPRDAPTVRAPWSGQLHVFDWSGTPGYQGDGYSTVIAIYDPRSHAIAQLMHVEPTFALKRARGFVNVRRGEPIGTLAKLGWARGRQAELFRHTHFSLIDGAQMRAYDPARFLPYSDPVPPRLVSVYLLDEDGQRHNTLISGEVDLVIEVADTDAYSGRNFEVDSIEYEVRAPDGTLLASSPRCAFDHLFDDVSRNYRLTTLNLIDFGNARAQVDNAWPQSDIGNRTRTFRYALTQFGLRDGRCYAKTDAEGHLDLAPSLLALVVRGTMWDVRGNVRSFVRQLLRAPGGLRAPRPVQAGRGMQRPAGQRPAHQQRAHQQPEHQQPEHQQPGGQGPAKQRPSASNKPWPGLTRTGTVGVSGLRITAELPAGRFAFQMHGQGDADLYVRVGAPPTPVAYDCRPYADHSDEHCVVELAEANSAHIWIRAHSGTATYELRGETL